LDPQNARAGEKGGRKSRNRVKDDRNGRMHGKADDVAEKKKPGLKVYKGYRPIGN